MLSQSTEPVQKVGNPIEPGGFETLRYQQREYMAPYGSLPA